jgi:hypothetical protein
VAETSFSIEELEKIFGEDPKRGHEQMRAWKSEHRAEFLRVAIGVLEGGMGNSFSQVLLQLCREDSSSLNQMLVTADLLSLDEAARLLRVSSKNDPSYQVDLIARVKAELDRNASALANSEFSRLLDILARSVDPEKLGGMLASLVEHPDERVRSKVAVIAAGNARVGSHKEGWLKDVDPRVRANAVESLWGRRDAEAIQLLKLASKDPHHRIAANALYGLYQAGEACSIRGVLRLFRELEVPRQLAGIWLLGQTGDPRFLTLVHENLSLKTGRIKFALLNAGRKIKKNLEELRQRPKLQFQMVAFERGARGRIRCSFLLRKANGDLLGSSDLRATEVLIQDGDLKIDQFHFEARGSGDPAHAVLAIPLRVGVSNAYASKLVLAVEEAVAGKRPGDAWAIQKYEVSGRSGEGKEAVEFTCSNTTLTQDQLRSVKGAAANVLEAIEGVAERFPAEATRRVIVGLLDPESELPAAPPEAWGQLFERHGLTLYLICCQGIEEDALKAWSQFCLSRKGAMLMARNVEQLPELLAQLSAGFASHFHLTYQLGRSLPNADPRERIQFEFIPGDGYGRVVIEGQGEIVVEGFGAEASAD